MSIERDRDSEVIRFNCDRRGCRKNFETDLDQSFDASWSEAKDRGWTTRKLGNNWFHRCPECEWE